MWGISGLLGKMVGQLRVRAPGVHFEAAEESAVDGYLERLIKLIPSEVVGAYVAGRVTAAEHHAAAKWAAACFIAVLVFRSLTTAVVLDKSKLTYIVRDTLRTAQWFGVIISAISFVIWVHALGDNLPWLSSIFPQYVAALALLLWTPFVPYIYKGS